MKEYIIKVNESDLTPSERMCIKDYHPVELVRCKDCKNWIPGYITDQDDFIPSKCGKYQQMVGHSNDDFCSLAEKKEGR